MEERNMKKIFISLAAIAALVSCVEEKGLEPQPQQPVGNQVTIKAVAAETKTLLGDDGTSVVWEENDAISVVVEGESDKYLETFTTSSTENTSIAEFTAVLSNELSADETVTGIGYAVYPATSVTLANGSVSIVHELPEEQTGTITSGMNLSYAKVDADDIKAGQTNAVFHNALTLLKVNVPAGVKSVVLTSNILSPALVGKVNFTVNKPSDDISFAKGSEVVTRRSVTLSNGGAELEEGVHDLLVFPGTAAELTLTMTGTDGAVYESTLNAVELVAGSYRTINLTQIFKMGVEDEMFISPAGGECEVKIASVADYTYDVAVTPTAGGDWLSYTLPTKGFHQDVITFSAEENTTGADRTADVTITWGEDQTRTFKMTQKSVYMDFVNDENGDPIQWEESFGVYATEADASSGTNATKSYSKKAFTIELSDNPAKGTYMITNMFYADSYFDANLQPATGGAKYYADYTDGVLTVKKNAAGNSYNFSGDISLTYDSANKRFTAAPIPTTSSSIWIGGYTVTVKVEEPEAPAGGDSVLNSLAGTWNQTVVGMSWPSPSATMTVSVEGNAVTLADFLVAGTVVTATFENNKIVVPAGTPIGSGNNQAGTLDTDVVLTLEGNTFTAPAFSIGGWINVSSYSAVNPNL